MDHNKAMSAVCILLNSYFDSPVFSPIKQNLKQEIMGNCQLCERRIPEDQGADGRIILQQTELALDKARFGNLR